jgi:hypothetical protein
MSLIFITSRRASNVDLEKLPQTEADRFNAPITSERLSPAERAVDIGAGMASARSD